MFEKVEKGPPDPMYVLKRQADGDTCPDKVDLGVGIYRNEEGLYQELDCIHQVWLAVAGRIGREQNANGCSIHRPKFNSPKMTQATMFVSSEKAQFSIFALTFVSTRSPPVMRGSFPWRPKSCSDRTARGYNQTK